jgi:hypothetical protein
MISLEIAKQYLLNLRKISPLNFTIPIVAGIVGVAIFLRRKIAL